MRRSSSALDDSPPAEADVRSVEARPGGEAVALGKGHLAQEAERAGDPAAIAQFSLDGEALFAPRARRHILAQDAQQHAQAIERMGLPLPAPRGAADRERFFMQRGSTTYREPIDVRNWIDTSYIDYAVQQLGPYRS